MVNLKPENKKKQEISRIDYRGFRFKHLILFILGSAIAHVLLFLLLAKYEANKPLEEQEERKPIEFVVVPPEEKSEEPPPETNNRAAENSVANQNVQPEKTAPNEEISEAPAKAPPPAAKPEPTPTTPTPTPKPKVSTQPTPAPEPAPEPTPESESEPEPQDLISGSDAPITSPQPEEPKTPQKETVATRTAPPTESVPESAPGKEGSAADLLGGDYKKTLADGGGEAFFSPEALSFKTVLNPQQLNAVKDFDLEGYNLKVRDKVKPHWHPNRYTSEKYTTVLTFNILPSGQITDLEMVQSSGSAEFDQAALKGIQNALPLDSLPANFPLESLPFQFEFNLY